MKTMGIEKEITLFTIDNFSLKKQWSALIWKKMKENLWKKSETILCDKES